MNEEEKIITEDVETVKYEEEKKRRKEEFDNILDKIKKMSDAIEFHANVKKAVSNDEVDNNYLNYIENSLEDKLFNDIKFDKINPKILLEVVCPELASIDNFDVEKLEIVDIGSHFEEEENYIDKICTYNNQFICLFGVSQTDQSKVLKYEPRKFSRTDIVQAICNKLEEGRTVTMEQYDEYYVVIDGDSLKVFSERKITALAKVEETIFDKIKSKLASIFAKNPFSKNKFLPNIELIYDNNPNRLKNFKVSSKVDAKNRMKTLLTKERAITRSTN